MRRTVFVLAMSALLAISAAAQKTDFLDVSTVKINPEKHAQFTTLLKKAADVNRRMGGDHWLTAGTVYGEGHVYNFVTPRENFGAVEAAHERFMKAMREGFGPAAMERLHSDWMSCLVSERNEFRRRRWELTANAPEASGLAKVIANARWISTTKVKVRPGRVSDYTELLKIQKEAIEKNEPSRTVFVSQTVAGGSGPTFYITRLVHSLGDLDSGKSFRDLLGDQFGRYEQTIREVSLGSESTISRIIPELSSMPKEFTDLSPEFWNPKPAAAASAGKPKKTAPVSAP